eukprot:snap_masked-scaffold_4-processed-gene-18.32-mRNA-1 protein AED:1.00 eAED:1.00 QI:0/-1/0/0/-1/1/1/0/186
MASSLVINGDTTKYQILVNYPEAAWAKFKAEFKEFLRCVLGDQNRRVILKEVGNLQPGTVYWISRKDQPNMKARIVRITQFSEEDGTLGFDIDAVDSSAKFAALVKRDISGGTFTVTITKTKVDVDEAFGDACMCFCCFDMYVYEAPKRLEAKQASAQTVQMALERFFHVPVTQLVPEATAVEESV